MSGDGAGRAAEAAGEDGDGTEACEELLVPQGRRVYAGMV